MKGYRVLIKAKIKHLYQDGFTIIEVMAVIAIVAILAVFAVPEFAVFVAKKNAESAAVEVVNSLKLARSQAMSSGRTMYVCALNGDNANGFTGCSDGSDWSKGWGIVIADLSGEDGVYRVYQPSSNVSVTARKIEVKPNGLQTGGSFDIVIHPNAMGDDVSVDKTVSIFDASMGYKVN